MQAMLALCRTQPRDEIDAVHAMRRASQRAGLALRAEYRFSRGRTPVVGPSVYLAREAARCWGNIHCGFRIISMSDDMINIEGYALDLQTCARVACPDAFRPRVQRKNRRTGETEWVVPDERDLRELINKRGAIAQRNAILQVIPSDVIEDFVEWCRSTSTQAASGELNQDREKTVRSLLVAFRDLRVLQEELEAYLQHSIYECDAEEIAHLRAVWRSMSDGNTKREDHFGGAPAKKANAPAEELANELDDKQVGAQPPKEAPKSGQAQDDPAGAGQAQDPPSEPTNDAPKSGLFAEESRSSMSPFE